MLMGSCLVWRRPLDMKVLGLLANLMSWLILVWVSIRVLDLALHGKLGLTLQADVPALLFWAESLLAQRVLTMLLQLVRGTGWGLRQ